jgi:hypothetical protein
MRRQELFHGEAHLNSVSRAAGDIAAQVFFILPIFMSPQGSTVTRDTYFFDINL